jgi:hypothetical protein
MVNRMQAYPCVMITQNDSSTHPPQESPEFIHGEEGGVPSLGQELGSPHVA